MKNHIFLDDTERPLCGTSSMAACFTSAVDECKGCRRRLEKLLRRLRVLARSHEPLRRVLEEAGVDVHRMGR